MPYLLMLAGILLFGLGWMLRQKPKPVKQKAEIHAQAPLFYQQAQLFIFQNIAGWIIGQ